ncbi:hypothetical protein GQ53DRAFT_438421 [Thozetella sp. PMI_491]|nr:hypothetical protein GQ53DRAFT_438421 [Thozetella sp. PMI_491]
MPQTVELAWAPIKQDASEETIKGLKALAPEVKAQKGLVAMYHGTVTERPHSIEFVTIWESEEDYKASQTSEVHGKVSGLFKDLVDTSDPAQHPYHNTIVFSQPFGPIADAPVTSMTAIFLPTTADTAAFEAAWEDVVKNGLGTKPEGFIAGAHGWTADEVKGHPKISPAKLFVAASGWESVEKNEAAHASLAERFSELRKFTEVVDTHHTVFEKDN